MKRRSLKLHLQRGVAPLLRPAYTVGLIQPPARAARRTGVLCVAGAALVVRRSVTMVPAARRFVARSPAAPRARHSMRYDRAAAVPGRPDRRRSGFRQRRRRQARVLRVPRGGRRSACSSRPFGAPCRRRWQHAGVPHPHGRAARREQRALPRPGYGRLRQFGGLAGFTSSGRYARDCA